MSSPADPRGIRLGTALLWGAVCFAASTSAADESRWEFPVSTGYDVYVHDYFLADTDTTEVIQEFNLTASANGSSAWGAQHRWFFRGSASGGTELFRQSLDAGLRLRTGSGHEWLRSDLLVLARQFRDDSGYSLSSDNSEGRLLVGVSPWSGDDAALELRTRGRFVQYADPSTLEVDYLDGAAGAYLKSAGRDLRSWSLGGMYTGRDYADSTEINREGFLVEAEYDHGALEGELRGYHRTERRNIADETARPSAWFHWSELNSAFPASHGEVVLRASSEVWDYDEMTGAWYDSWLAGAELGARWGDPLEARFECLVTTEHLLAGDQPESYSQGGLRFGADTMGNRFSGSASIELGHRWYRAGELLSTDAFVLSYSDFSYLALWIMLNWRIDEHFSTDLAVNYEPENHTERDDNVTLGFASLRVVWRP